MEKTLKYTTLKGLISKTTQFNFNNFLSKRFYHKKYGWCKFKLNEKSLNEMETLFKSVVGDLDLNINKSFGIFDRLIIREKYNSKGLICNYIARQNYPSELRTIRKLIKEN
jgi:hypothetical protein